MLQVLLEFEKKGCFSSLLRSVILTRFETTPTPFAKKDLILKSIVLLT